MGAPPYVTSTARANAEQQRRAVAYGYELLQLISVLVSGGDVRQPPCGTVTAFDGKRGQILYSRHRRDQDPSHLCCHAQGFLLLTGPYRAISAEGSIAIKLDLYKDDSDEDTALDSEDEAASSRSSEILWNVYSGNAVYDEPIVETIDTRYGPVDVTYIVLGNAVEGSFEVRLTRRGGANNCHVHGWISISYIDDDDSEVVLFNRELCARLLEELDVPLARSVVAAPLEKRLKVEVNLRDLDEHEISGNEIVRGSRVVNPGLYEHDVLSFGGANGDMVEVKITWSSD